MRYLFFTLLGFFGPALIMLLLRLIWQQLCQRFRQRSNQPEIIDITPLQHKPSKLFISTWVMLSLLCTALLIWQMDDQPASKQHYIPAHINAEGQFIPGETTPDHSLKQE